MEAPSPRHPCARSIRRAAGARPDRSDRDPSPEPRSCARPPPGRRHARPRRCPAPGRSRPCTRTPTATARDRAPSRGRGVSRDANRRRRSRGHPQAADRPTRTTARADPTTRAESPGSARPRGSGSRRHDSAPGAARRGRPPPILDAARTSKVPGRKTSRRLRVRRRRKTADACRGWQRSACSVRPRAGPSGTRSLAADAGRAGHYQRRAVLVKPRGVGI